MKNKIYIIGNIPYVIDRNCEAKFYKTQMQLLQMGYDVINPLERLTNKELDIEVARRKNLNDLMFAKAVYIMPCVSFGENIKILEVKMALDLNLTIILGTIDLSVDIKADKLLRRRRRKNKMN